MAEPAPVDRCPRCRCGNCGDLLADHAEAGCAGEECELLSAMACSVSRFEPPEGIGLFAQQLAPLLSAHLNPAADLYRTRAVAHAAHHALIDYDYPEERHDV